MRTVFKIIFGIVSILFTSGCNRESEETPAKDSFPSVTYVNTLSGGGDIGYTDQIIDGLMQFNNLFKISLSIKNPSDMDEVGATILDWYTSSQKSNNKSVLVLGDYMYEECLNNLNLHLSDSQNIIIVDTPLSKNRQKGVYSFFISRYGISYLAGLMAGNSDQANIIAACQGIKSIDESVAGFSAGYKQASGKEAGIVYLDSDYKGFSSSQKAYECAKDLDGSFIYPLAGGSNNGVFRYTRENPFTTMLVAGMDTDCSVLSTRVPFSVIIPIAHALTSVLTDWYENKIETRDLAFCLGDEFGAKIMLNESFLSNVWIWEDYYDSPDYWNNQLKKYSEEAQLIEKRYYEK
ncbi:MAG: BMP family ABC transporter substrate-binding protein [Muribaculaceae bacterium]|nr:BMP family ABC transporter substrate-binding protein [Muribaculaceae bacterium]MDE6754549.1 BMP family ABC transporter substrate-binding protein [Muribaculaceae bacterium]